MGYIHSFFLYLLYTRSTLFPFISRYIISIWHFLKYQFHITSSNRAIEYNNPSRLLSPEAVLGLNSSGTAISHVSYCWLADVLSSEHNLGIMQRCRHAACLSSGDAMASCSPFDCFEELVDP